MFLCYFEVHQDYLRKNFKNYGSTQYLLVTNIKGFNAKDDVVGLEAQKSV